MLDKRIVIELIKCIEKIQFTEQIEGDTIVVYSVLPLIDEAFMSKQITHALSEIWDMNNVVNSTCK